MSGVRLARGVRVTVPWGLDEVQGRVLDVWGDPPRHVRVELEVGEGDEDLVELILSAEIVEPLGARA